MATISVELKGMSTIDNAAIFFNDPQEKLPHFLQPQSGTVWTASGINVPMDDNDELNYVLNVVAFTGTDFECELINQVQKTIKFSDTTGKMIKHRAITKGTEKFT